MMFSEAPRPGTCMTYENLTVAEMTHGHQMTEEAVMTHGYQLPYSADNQHLLG